MGILDRFHSKQQRAQLKTLATKPLQQADTQSAAAASVKKEEHPVRPAAKTGTRNTGLGYRIVLRPHNSEKATNAEQRNQYVFHVHPSANKVQVRQAIWETYGVRPLAVRMARVRGKTVRYGRHQGERRTWKKAVVSLKKGETIHAATA